MSLVEHFRWKLVIPYSDENGNPITTVTDSEREILSLDDLRSWKTSRNQTLKFLGDLYDLTNESDINADDDA